MEATKTNYTYKFSNTAMSQELFEILNQMASEQGTSRSELIRELIWDHYAERQEAMEAERKPCDHNLPLVKIGMGTYECPRCHTRFDEAIPY